MEFIIRIVLMFLFIQFVVVMTIMSVALLLARTEVPTLGREFGNKVLRSIVRLLHLMHLRGVQ